MLNKLIARFVPYIRQFYFVSAFLNAFSTETPVVEDHLYQEHSILLNTCTHEYSIPHSKVRGIDKVVAYILVGLMFSSIEQRDQAIRLVKEAIIKGNNNEVIVVFTSRGTCTLRFTFQQLFIG